MAKRHKYAGASASISTGLDAGRIAQIAQRAAEHAETLQVSLRLEESTLGRLVFSARNRVVGGRIEFMAFEVVLKESNGIRTVKTRILNYKKQKRQWIFIIPLPWCMLAWSNYRSSCTHSQRGSGQRTLQPNPTSLNLRGRGDERFTWHSDPWGNIWFSYGRYMRVLARNRYSTRQDEAPDLGKFSDSSPMETSAGSRASGCRSSLMLALRLGESFNRSL